jgi:spermidine synthase
LWQEDGRESSIAVIDKSDRAFVVNGKIDGSARGDGPTQVMGGLIGALIHPAPRSALIIGLGTGSTAGWLAAVPAIERVDVVELEPAVLRVARDFAPVNHGCMENPKVRIHLNDAREVLLTTPQRYDIIFSEPSNPYRAGIASLYTEEFYRAASERLQRGGLFLQWVQSYEIDSETVRSIYATMTAVFGQVDTWRTTPSDLILVASRDRVRYDADQIRTRIRQEPFAFALSRTWRVQTLEGVLGHFVGGDAIARQLGADGESNTDDRTVIEFGLARTVGRTRGFQFVELMNAARQSKADRPASVSGSVDWDLVELNRWTHARVGPPVAGASELVKARHAFVTFVESRNDLAAAAAWRRRPWRPVNSLELSRLATALAEEGSDEAETFLADLRRWEPAEAIAIEGLLRKEQERHDEASRLVSEALHGARSDPWFNTAMLHRLLTAAAALSELDRRYAAAMYEAMKDPFPAGHANDSRRTGLVSVARALEGGCGPRTVAALRDLEPNAPWNEAHLAMRAKCYAAAGLDGLRRRAERDWQSFHRAAGEPLVRVE